MHKERQEAVQKFKKRRHDYYSINLYVEFVSQPVYDSHFNTVNLL